MSDKLEQDIINLKSVSADVANSLLEIISSTVCEASSTIGASSGKETALEIEEIKEFASVKEFLTEGNVITTEIALSGVDGSFVFAFKEEDAISLSNIESKPKEKGVSEAQLTGLSDVVGQFSVGISEKLSSVLNLEITSKEPVLKAELSEGFDNEVIVVYLNLKEDAEAKTVYQILPVSLVKELVNAKGEGASVKEAGILDDVVDSVQKGNYTETQGAVTVQPVSFASFDNLSQIHAEGSKNLDLLMDIKLKLTVELGRTELPIRKVLELTRGSVIELDKVAGEPVELFANGKLIAIGEVVVIEDNFGLRLTGIVSPEHRVKNI